MVKRIALTIALFATIVALVPRDTLPAQNGASQSAIDLTKKTPTAAHSDPADSAAVQLRSRLDSLRASDAGAWSLDTLEAAVTTLLERNEPGAALWWTNRALAHPAHRRGQTKKRLLALEKKVGAAWKKRAPDQVRLGLKMAKHASSIASGRNLRLAKRAADQTARHITIFGNPPARRVLARVQKKLARAKKITDTNGRSLKRQRDKTDELSKASITAITAELDAWVGGYECGGDPTAYEAMCDLVSDVIGEADTKRARELTWRLRRATLSMRDAEVLILHVQAVSDLTIEVAGERVARQTSMCWNREPKVIKVKVLPGDWVLVRSRRSPRVKSRHDMLAVAGTIGERTLSVDDIFSTPADSTAALWGASIVPATLGEKTEINPAEHQFPSDFKNGIQFRTEAQGRPVTLTLAMHPRVEAWFAKMKAKPIFALGTKTTPHFAIRIPAAVSP